LRIASVSMLALPHALLISVCSFLAILRPPGSTLFPYTTLFRSQGVMQPIVVRLIGPEKYEIIAGERRWRAAQLASLDKIPANWRSEEHTSELQSRENLVCRLLLEKKKTASRPRRTRVDTRTPSS